MTATYTYDAFGAVRSHTGTGTTEFTFTGEQNDPNGLEYLPARYGASPEHGRRDNATGRFMSGDPLGSGYGYAGGNPVNRVDRSGLEWTCPYNDYFGGDICFETDDLGSPADPSCGCFAYGGDPITDAYHEFMCGCTPDGGNHAAQATASNAGAGTASATAGCDGPCVRASGSGGGGGCRILGIGCSTASTILDAFAVGFQSGAAVITDLATAAGCIVGGPVGCGGGYALGYAATVPFQVIATIAGDISAGITCAADPSSADCSFAAHWAVLGTENPEPNIGLAIDIHVFCRDVGLPC